MVGHEHVVGEAGERMADQVGEEIDHPEGLRRDDTDCTHGDEQRALDPDADQRNDQGDVAEIQEVGRSIVAQIDRNQHGHEDRVGELEPQRNAACGRRARPTHDRVAHMIRRSRKSDRCPLYPQKADIV